MVVDRLKNDFPATYAAELCMWPFAQARTGVGCAGMPAAGRLPTSTSASALLLHSVLTPVHLPSPSPIHLQTLNFSSIPVAHQLLFTNVVCLIDSTLLSWVKHRSMEEGGLLKMWLHPIEAGTTGASVRGEADRSRDASSSSSGGGPSSSSSSSAGTGGGGGKGSRGGVIPVGLGLSGAGATCSPLYGPSLARRRRTPCETLEASLGHAAEGDAVGLGFSGRQGSVDGDDCTMAVARLSTRSRAETPCPQGGKTGSPGRGQLRPLLLPPLIDRGSRRLRLFKDSLQLLPVCLAIDQSPSCHA